jgi:acetoin utilization deacetylase AcuC-like enzyme
MLYKLLKGDTKLVLSLLEGGYHLQRTGECVARHLAVLSGQARG